MRSKDYSFFAANNGLSIRIYDYLLPVSPKTGERSDENEMSRKLKQLLNSFNLVQY
jgi:hypothetical protein